jgi:hypothetical protein
VLPVDTRLRERARNIPAASPGGIRRGDDLIAGIDEVFPETDRFQAALYRGGHFSAGVIALYTNDAPSHSRVNTGFRCAR